MGIADKFINLMKLGGDEEDDYDEDYDEDYDDFEDEKPAPRRKPQRNDDYDDVAPRASRSNSNSYSQPKPKNSQRKLVVMKNNKNYSNSDQRLFVFKPISYEDCKYITDNLLMGITVFINLEGIHNDLAQRVIDYTSGACVAIDGNFQKVSNMVFVATPRGVAITGDMMDLLGESVNNYDY